MKLWRNLTLHDLRVKTTRTVAAWLIRDKINPGCQAPMSFTFKGSNDWIKQKIRFQSAGWKSNRERIIMTLSSTWWHHKLQIFQLFGSQTTEKKKQQTLCNVTTFSTRNQTFLPVLKQDKLVSKAYDKLVHVTRLCLYSQTFVTLNLLNTRKVK